MSKHGTHTMYDKGDAGTYVIRVSEATGKSKSQVLKECVRCAIKNDLYNISAAGKVQKSNTSGDVDDAGGGNASQPDGGVHAGDLPRDASESDAGADGDASTSQGQNNNGNGGRSFFKNPFRGG